MQAVDSVAARFALFTIVETDLGQDPTRRFCRSIGVISLIDQGQHPERGLIRGGSHSLRDVGSVCSGSNSTLRGRNCGDALGGPTVD